MNKIIFNVSIGFLLAMTVKYFFDFKPNSLVLEKQIKIFELGYMEGRLNEAQSLTKNQSVERFKKDSLELMKIINAK